MNRQCAQLRDAIVKQGMAEQDLSPELLRHADGCAACAEVLGESQRMAAMVLAAATTPPVPDCRSAIRDRIRSRSVRQPVMVYVFAAVLIIVLVGAAIRIVPQVGEHPQRSIVVEKPHPQVTPTSPEIPPSPVSQDTPIVKSPVPEVGKETVRTTTRIHRTYTVKPAVIRIETPPAPTEEEVRPRLVFTTWTKPPVNTDVSFSYTIRNETTNEVTTCSAERSGDSVNIYLACSRADELPTPEGGTQ